MENPCRRSAGVPYPDYIRNPTAALSRGPGELETVRQVERRRRAERRIGVAIPALVLAHAARRRHLAGRRDGRIAVVGKLRRADDVRLDAQTNDGDRRATQ